MKEYKKPINERVIKVLKTLLEGQTLTSLASDLGVKQTKLSEIMAERMAAGLDVISELCIRFSVSPDFLLLGIGTMWRTNEIHPAVPYETEEHGGLLCAAEPAEPFGGPTVSELKRENERLWQRYDDAQQVIGSLRAENASLKEQAARYAEKGVEYSGTTQPVES